MAKKNKSKQPTSKSDDSDGLSTLPAVSKRWAEFISDSRSSEVAELQHVLGVDSESSLHWLLPGVLNETKMLRQVQKWSKSVSTGKKSKSSAKEIVAAIAEINPERMSFEQAYLLLGAVHGLRMCLAQLSESDSLRLIDDIERLTATVNLDVDEDPWLFQLANVELPITLMFQLDGIARSGKKVCKSAIKKMQSLVAEILDGDGLPKSDCLRAFGPLVASWSRTLAISKTLGLKFASEPAYQLEWAARQTIRLTRPDGTLMSSDFESNALTKNCIELVLQMSADQLDQKVAGIALPGGKARSAKGQLPEESSFSEWAEVGVYQRDWRRKSPKCAFTFGDGEFWLEVVQSATLLEGNCTAQVSMNGSVLKPLGEFSVVCEHRNSEVDYVELELPLEKGVKLQRQLVFAKQDEFLILADIIQSESAERFDYFCEFPMGPGVEGVPETETCEIYLKDSKIRSLVLPLALPEWKIARTDDRLECRDNRLSLSQSISGRGLFAGLFFDLSSKRSLKPRTWRQLTVAESLSIVDRDTAVAFRIQVGRDQWVVYRAITPHGNRTFFGENITDDFFVGRFQSNGEVAELLQIE